MPNDPEDLKRQGQMAGRKAKVFTEKLTQSHIRGKRFC